MVMILYGDQYANFLISLQKLAVLVLETYYARLLKVPVKINCPLI